MAAVAEKSVDQVTAQVKRARTFFERGAVARNDVLRAELGLAASQQRLIQANGMVSLARGRLATLMGRSPDTEVDPVDITGEPTARPLLPVGQAEQQAVDTRFEIKEIAAHIEQATAGVRMAKSKMVPQVNAVANYTRQTSSLLGLPESRGSLAPPLHGTSGRVAAPTTASTIPRPSSPRPWRPGARPKMPFASMRAMHTLA
jgi:outer membrane protein TolC